MIDKKKWMSFKILIICLTVLLLIWQAFNIAFSVFELLTAVFFVSFLLILSFKSSIESGTGTTSSITLPVILPSIYLLGPFYGSLIAAIGTIQSSQLASDYPRTTFLTNRGMIYLAASISSLWLFFIDNSQFMMSHIWVLVMMGITFSLVNHLLLWLGLTIIGQAQGEEFLLFALESAKTVVISTIFGTIFIIVFQTQGIAGAALLGVLVFMFKDVLLAHFRNRNSVIQVIESFAQVIDYKDPYTRGHSEQVSKYAVDIGKNINMSPHRLSALKQAAKLHDIGKIGLPDAILLKPKSLTITEFQQVKTHPERGEKLLAEIEILKDLLPAIRHHHERYDGRGYPDGLQATAIPLEARILTIADAFDCMTSDRVYRKALSKERVISELQAQKKQQFDPKLTDILLTLIAQGYYNQLFVTDKEGKHEEKSAHQKFQTAPRTN